MTPLAGDDDDDDVEEADESSVDAPALPDDAVKPVAPAIYTESRGD